MEYRPTLSNTKSKTLRKDFSEPFTTKRGFKQGYSSSSDFFNLMLRKTIQAAELYREGTIFYKLLAYADDIGYIGINNRAVLSKRDIEAKGMGLEVKEGKTKYLLPINKQHQQQIGFENHRRITLTNRSYFRLSRQLKSTVLSRRTKMKLFKSVSVPVRELSREMFCVKFNILYKLGTENATAGGIIRF